MWPSPQSLLEVGTRSPLRRPRWSEQRSVTKQLESSRPVPCWSYLRATDLQKVDVIPLKHFRIKFILSSIFNSRLFSASSFLNQD
jgi:hypothetical protein